MPFTLESHHGSVQVGTILYANANHSVPLHTVTKIDHLFKPCRAVLTRVDELCTLQTTNYSMGNHMTIDHTQQNYQFSTILVLQCELA